MRLESVGGSRLIPEPTMPPGLVELMEDLTRSVLKNNPPDLYEYCAKHMAKLIEIRDGRGPIPQLTLEQKIARAQRNMRKKAEQRRRKYDMEMELLRKSAEEEHSINGQEIKNVSETENVHKTPIRQDDEIRTHLSELEISHLNRVDSVSINQEDKNRVAVVSVEHHAKEDSEINNSKNLKTDAPEEKIVETDAKTSDIVGIDTIDRSEISTDTVEIQETTAIIMSQDEKENIKIKDIKQEINIIVNDSIETLNEIMANDSTVEESNTFYATTEEKVTKTEILDSKTYNTKEQNNIVQLNDDKYTNVRLKANQDDDSVEKTAINVKIPDVKSDCTNASNKLAHFILNDIVHTSEACVNEEVEGKESKVEDKYDAEINQLEQFENQERGFNSNNINLAENVNSDTGAANDKDDIERQNKDKDKNNITENLSHTEDADNKEKNTNDVVHELSNRELQEQKVPNEIPAQIKTAYLCGEEIEELKEMPANDKINNKFIKSQNDNEVLKIKDINQKTELSEFLNKTDCLVTTNTPIDVDQDSSEINSSEIIKNSLLINESELIFSCKTDNDFIDINNVKTPENLEKSSEVINNSLADISEDKILNVVANVTSEILSKNCSEKTINDDSLSPQDTKDDSKSEELDDTKIEKHEDSSNDKPVHRSIGAIKLSESMISNNANISKSDIEENKINPGEEKENDETMFTDPVTEYETIEIIVMENGHKDNDAPIEMPQDDTSTIEDTPEHVRNKRTEDEISDIQEMSGISDIPQLYTIETNSIGKCSSIGDSTIDENSDSNGESDNMKESTDLSQSQNIMDLETAAVTIQKVFRSFMFKSRCSTFDDTGNNDNNSMDEDREDMDYEVITSKERRPLGISRMDTVTVLQTVNEEKSLSLSTDDSSLSSAATIIQAHVRGFLLRNRLNSSKASSASLVNSDGHVEQSFDTNGEPQTNKTILNIQLVPEGGHYLSRDESMLTSVDLSLDASPPSSINLHPLGYDKNEPRKQLKREDAVQSVSPPSNNSGKLSEDVESIKEALPNDSTEHKSNTEVTDIEEKLNNNSCESTPSKSTTVETVIEVKGIINETVESSQENIEKDDKIKHNHSLEVSSDEADVVSPVITNGKYSRSNSDNTSGLLHSGEFHDIVLPTNVSRKTSVVRGE